MRIPSEARRQRWMLPGLEFQAAMSHTTWMLRTEPQSLARAGCRTFDGSIFNVLIAC